MSYTDDLILDFLQSIRNANSETAKKERFITFLTQLFKDDPSSLNVIEQMTEGAEKTVFNIPLKHRIKTGQADTLYNRVIIEWEKDLKRTGKHAEEQLKEYLAGNIKSGNEDNFTLIATDGEEWRVYNRIPTQLLKATEPIVANEIGLRRIDTFILTKDNLNEFFFFLDRYLFKNELEKPTLANIVIDFGADSGIFYRSINLMKTYLPGISGKADIETAYNEWKRFLSIAYGSFSDSTEIFFIHTYLSVFSKILAYTVVSPNKNITTDHIQFILNGSAFHKYNIEGFVEDDFYHWIATQEHFEALKLIFRDIVDKLANYDFSEVNEDILKGVYQELIDIETRHALGEYYTPDWLCELIINDLPLKKDSLILDPACGSGSFLRAAVKKLQHLYPNLSADRISSQVQGIDVHPLSVQIAKTTLLVALGKNILKARKPVILNIYLANSLLLPEGTTGLFGQDYQILIDNHKYKITKDVFEQNTTYDEAVRFADDIATRTEGQETFKEEVFTKSFIGTLGQQAKYYVSSFYTIYKALKSAKENDRDSIWAFILLNLYKPFFLNKRFDFVIGNPPWLTYSSISNANYQEDLYTLAQRNGLETSTANMPHLEIAAIFMAHSTSYFLKTGGILAFVLPRSFMSADQHDNSRSGKAKGFQLTKIWDLQHVSPLFNVPSVVLFARALPVELNADDRSTDRKIPETGIQGSIVKGRFETQNLNLEQALPAIELQPATWYYQKLSKSKKSSSAITTETFDLVGSQSFYAKHFRQGATIVPRSFYFVELAQQIDGNISDYDLLYVKTSQAILRDAKPPWKNLTKEGRVHTKFLYRTAISKNILPFGLINPLLVLLPIEIETVQVGDTEKKSITLKTEKDLLETGFLETSNWFKESEELWEENKTEKASDNNMSLYGRLNFQRGLTSQNLNTRYLVLYTASAKDACATIFDREQFEYDFIIEHKSYWFSTNLLNEALYLVSILNCSFSNKSIKSYQSKGLFGPRDIHKKILELTFPQFNPGNELHQQLAKLGEVCSHQVNEIIEQNYNDADLTANALGQARRHIREHLKKELSEIDKIVEAILRIEVDL